MTPHSDAEGDVSHHAPALVGPTQSKQLFNALYEQSVVGVALVDSATGRIVEANRRCGDITGLSLLDFAATPFTAIFYSEDVPTIVDRVEALKSGRAQTISLDIRCVKPDGTIIWVALRLAALSDSGPSPTVLMAILEDITERKQVEEALLASEAKFRALSDATSTAIFVYQSNRFLYANLAAIVISGYSLQELQLMPIWDVVHPEFRDQAKARLAAVERGSQVPARVEMPIRRKDGETRWLDCTAATILINGSPARIASAYDITERRQMEARERARLERVIRIQEGQLQLGCHVYEDLAQDLRTVVKITAETMEVERVSLWLFNNGQSALVCRELYERSSGTFGAESSLEVSGYPSYFEALERGLSVEASTAISDEATRELAEAYLEPRGITSMLDAPVRSAGQTIGVLCCEHVGAPRSWTPEETSFVASAADHVVLSFTAEDRKKATEVQQRLLEELVAARERLQGLSQRLMHLQEEERREIARDLHDEIGQALTLLRADLSDVKRTITGKSTAEPGAKLESGLATADGLIQRVRAMSLDLRPAMLDDLGLPDTVRWYVDRIAPRAGWTADVVVDEELEGLPKPIALAAFRIMQESLTNVMRHAEATEVRVEAVKKDGSLQLCIRDNGKGFDVERVLKQASQGLSVGLLSMQERLRVLGGEITIYSTPGTGTIVRMQIPLEVAV